MKTLHTHNEEMEKEFDEKFKKQMVDILLDPMTALSNSLELVIPETKSFITNQNKQLYIKIAEGELARLEEMKKPLIHDVNWAEGYNACLDTQEKYWNNILQELNK